MPDEAAAQDTTEVGPAGPPTTGDEDAGRTPGWREVLLVAAAVVAVSLGAAVLTGLLPASAQDIVFKTPLVIVILIVGTVGLLLRLAVRRPPA